MSLRRLLPWLVATLAIAMVVHYATLVMIPRLAMARVASFVGAANEMHYGKRPDASTHAVVRPSPDLIYAICPYDLSTGPLLVTAPVPQGTYWSVAIYDSDTNNFFARNDRQAGSLLRLTIMPPGGSSITGANAVTSPTPQGMVIMRTLVNSDAHLPALDAMRRQARCEIVR